jgi:hypothetical protein
LRDTADGLHRQLLIALCCDFGFRCLDICRVVNIVTAGRPISSVLDANEIRTNFRTCERSAALSEAEYRSAESGNGESEAYEQFRHDQYSLIK